MFITLLVNFITLSGLITILVDFITLSRSITLSGVYYIIRAKYIIINIFQDIPLVFMVAILKIGCVHVVYMYINNCYFIMPNTT